MVPTAKRIDWHRFYLPLLLILSWAYSWRALKSQDAWMNAAIGKWIWLHKAIPHHTLFLWTARLPWIAHSWLGDLLFYAVLGGGGSYWGPYLILTASSLAIALVIVLLWREWTHNGRATSLMTFLFALAMQGAWLYFEPRVDLFTNLLLTSTLILVMRRTNLSREKFHFNPWWLLLFAVWANLHGGVALGLAVVALAAICDLVQDKGAPRAIGLAMMAAACMLAIAINPYGFKLWTVFLTPHSRLFASILEWKPFWKSPAMDFSSVVDAFVLLLIAFIAWGLNPQRRWSQAAWLIFMTASFLMARRQIWPLEMTCLAVMAGNAESLASERLWLEWWKKRSADAGAAKGEIPAGLRRNIRVATIACLVLWICVAPRENPFPIHAVSPHLPVRLCEFVEAHNLRGRMFNDYSISNYLEYRWQDDRPLFLDSVNAYPDAVAATYPLIYYGTNQCPRLLDGLGINYVILGKTSDDEQWPALAVELTAVPQWDLVYEGEDGAVWIRKKPLPTPPGPPRLVVPRYMVK